MGTSAKPYKLYLIIILSLLISNFTLTLESGLNNCARKTKASVVFIYILTRGVRVHCPMIKLLKKNYML